MRSNADPEGLQTDESIIAALERVQLWDKLKGQGGLDATHVISSMSRGEQQLFAVARALLKVQAKNSKIVLLDEATSSVDPKTEQLVMQILREEPFASCTMRVSIRINSYILEFQPYWRRPSACAQWELSYSSPYQHSL